MKKSQIVGAMTAGLLLAIGVSAWAGTARHDIPTVPPPKGETTQLLEHVRMDAAQQSEEQKSVRTLYDEGFTMVGEDDTLKIGAWMQTDFRTFFKGHPNNTQFLVRRARIDLKGSLDKLFGFRLMGEFEGDHGTNAANLKEGYVEYNQFPSFRIRVGQFKEPWGLENMYGDLWLDFLERPAVENFIRPEQDLGLMFFGKLFGKRLEYGVGLFNGSGTNVEEVNDDKDVAGRIALTPFAASDNTWMKHLTFGGSATYGKQAATLDGTGPTTAVGTRYLTFVNPTAGNDVTLNSYRSRFGGDLEWIVGPFSLKGEYAYTRFRDLTFAGAVRAWRLHGVHGQITYVVTGENKSNQGPVVPLHPFNPKEGHWGAVELAGRFELGRSDHGLIDAGFATGTDDLWAATGGVNWYLNRHVRWSTNYIYTKFNEPIANAGGKGYEHAIFTRFQFNL